MGVGGQRHAPATLPRERPGTHFIGGWVGPSVGMDGCGKSRPHRIRSPDRPGRSESLYRLSYPGPYKSGYMIILQRCIYSLCHIVSNKI
jgi:hypothetical protein